MHCTQRRTSSHRGSTFGALSSSLARALAAASLLAVVGGAAVAQEGEGIPIELLASVAYSHSFQDTDLDSGGSFSDGNGLDLNIGFQLGDHFLFGAGYQWQSESDYDIHFFPIEMRFFGPALLDRIRVYGQLATGPFFSRLHNEFNAVDSDQDNARGWAWRAGGGVEVAIQDGFSAIVSTNYTKGFGSEDDYKYTTVGVGFAYRWDP
jgi:hypothetical protein